MSPVSIHAAWRERCDRDPGGDAIVTETGCISFDRFGERVETMMALLVREGWAPGTVTGIAIRHPQLHLVCSMALLCLGGPQVALASFETPLGNREVAKRLNVSITVCDRPEDWMAGTTLIRVSDDAHLAGTAPAGSGPPPSALTSPDDAAIFVKTSGSTAAPRIFAMSVGRLLNYAAEAAADEKQRRVLRPTSAEIDGTRIYRLYALLAGRPAILPPTQLTRLGAFCAALDVTRVHAFAYFLNMLMANPATCLRLPDTTSLLMGGSRISAEMRREIVRRLTDKLWVSYATSEVGPISIASPEQHARYPEGVGVPVRGAEVEILREDGAPAAPDEVGEIRVRIPHGARSYVGEAGDPFRDGWFYPRDLLSRAPDGPLIYHGRADDVMSFNGIKIHPAAIEDVLEAHPDVAEAVAFPLHSRIHGQMPAAVVRPREDAPAETNHLLGYCRKHLGPRAPSRIILVDRIPRTQMGKPLRRALSELYG